MTDSNNGFTLGEERRSSVTGKKVRDYVDNYKLSKAIIKYNIRHKENMENGRPQEKMPDIIGLGIMKIADGLGSRHNFRGYTYVDEMVADARVQAVYAVTKFKIDNLMLSPVEQGYSKVFLDPSNFIAASKRKKKVVITGLAGQKTPLPPFDKRFGRKIKTPSAYAYLTLVMWRSMTSRIKEEAEQQRLIEDLMMDPSVVCYEADMNDNDHYVDINKENAVDFYFDGK